MQCALAAGVFALAACETWTPKPMTALVQVMDRAKFEAACEKAYRAIRGEHCPPGMLAFAIPGTICRIYMLTSAPTGTLEHEGKHCTDLGWHKKVVGEKVR